MLTINPNQNGLINQGTFRASNGGILELVGDNSFSGQFTNTGGTISALDGSEVRLTTLVNIIGGTLSTEGTGTIRTPASLFGERNEFRELHREQRVGTSLMGPSTTPKA